MWGEWLFLYVSCWFPPTLFFLCLCYIGVCFCSSPLFWRNCETRPDQAREIFGLKGEEEGDIRIVDRWDGVFYICFAMYLYMLLVVCSCNVFIFVWGKIWGLSPNRSCLTTYMGSSSMQAVRASRRVQCKIHVFKCRLFNTKCCKDWADHFIYLFRLFFFYFFAATN